MVVEGAGDLYVVPLAKVSPLAYIGVKLVVPLPMAGELLCSRKSQAVLKVAFLESVLSG